MRYINLFIVSSLLLILSSCVHDSLLVETRGSFVAGYVIGDLEAVFSSEERGNTISYPGRLSNYKIIIECKKGARYIWQDSQGQDSILYHNLSVKNNDVAYPNKYTSKFPNLCFYHNFTDIEVTSNQDYDEQHKAGTSLLDLVYFYTSSCQRYIESNYEESGFHYNNVLLKGDSLTPSHLKLLRCGGGTYFFEINFPIPPTLSKTHLFTVTITADDGTRYVLPVEATFE